MLDQDTNETLDAAKQHTMNHDRAVRLIIWADIIQIELLRHLEIQLNGTALPGTAQAIFQMEV